MSEMKETADPKPEKGELPLVPYRTYVFVWLGLLVFTVLTICSAELDMGKLSTAGSIAIATCKAAMVLIFFMGLRYETILFRWMFLVTVVTLSIFFVLTYADVVFR